MKKVFLLFMLLLVVVPLFAATLVKIDEVDDFGDPTGKSYLTFDQDLSGTFKNSSTSGSLKWNIVIDPKSGKAYFVLKENGNDVDVTTSSWSPYYLDDSIYYTVSLKSSDNKVSTLYGKLCKTGSYKTNGLTIYGGLYLWGYLYDYALYNCISFFGTGDSFKVSIKSDYGSYSLGVLDMSGFPALEYDDSLYNEGVQLMEAGKYQEAIDVFEKYKATDAVSYAHFKTDEQVEKCKVALLDDSPYRKGVQLMEEGKYQEALDVFEEYKINDEASYVHFETDVQVDKCRKAIKKVLGLYDVGDIGPAGGYVFYDCDADNDSGNADGLVSSECGWRYLEAAPADLGVVGGVPTVDATVSGYGSAGKYHIFGYYRTSASGSNQTVGTGTSIGTGKSNTERLVAAMKDNAYTDSSGRETTSDYAARLCSMLEYEHDGVVYDDWFLPSKGELNLMYQNLKENGLGSFADSKYYWSSSEGRASRAWEQDFGYGYQSDYYRLVDSYVRPVRAF